VPERVASESGPEAARRPFRPVLERVVRAVRRIGARRELRTDGVHERQDPLEIRGRHVRVEEELDVVDPLLVALVSRAHLLRPTRDLLVTFEAQERASCIEDGVSALGGVRILREHLPRVTKRALAVEVALAQVREEKEREIARLASRRRLRVGVACELPHARGVDGELLFHRSLDLLFRLLAWKALRIGFHPVAHFLLETTDPKQIIPSERRTHPRPLRRVSEISEERLAFL